MKLKKLLVVLLSLIFVFSSVLLLCGCDEEKPKDEETIVAPTKIEFSDALFMESENVTQKIKIKTSSLYDDSSLVIVSEIDSNKVKMQATMEENDIATTQEVYLKEENGVIYGYSYNETDEAWYYEVVDESELNTQDKELINEVQETLKDLYDDLKWDSKTSSFTGANITKTIDKTEMSFEEIKITFADKKITYIKMVMAPVENLYEVKVTEEIWLSNYGTTSVTLPNATEKVDDTKQIESWGDSFRLIGKMEEKGWFGSNYAVISHETARANWQADRALFMIEGSWSRSDAKANGSGDDITSERMLIPMPNVSANWIYDGSPAGRGDAVIGGCNYGWMVSRNAWEDPAKHDAVLAFIHTMTNKDLLDNAWANKETINSAGSISSEEWQEASLASYSMMKMASSLKTVTPMDSRLSPSAMTALRAGVVNVGSTEESIAKSVLKSVIDTNSKYYTPYLTYEPSTKGSKRVANIPSDISATLDVTTLCYSGDWQAQPYEAAINGGKVWGYDNTANCLATKYPNIKVVRNDIRPDNAIKDHVNTMWREPENMPDVIYWYGDAQSAPFRDDDHLVPIAEIQAEYGDYASHLNSQYFDKYALPVVGTYEALFVNVKLLAGLNGFEDIKTLYDSYQSTLVWGKNEYGRDVVISSNNEKKVALYEAVKTKLSTWEGLEMACDGALANDIVPFAQDKIPENNYLVDQAIMMMGGTQDYLYVPGAKD